MTQSLAIAACGGALGILLSFWIIDTLLAYFNEGKSAIDSLQVSPNPLVLSFSIALSVLAAVMFGLAPAWQSVKRDLLSGLKEASAGTTMHQRAVLRKAIIVVQLSLSLVMLFAAGLLTRTLARLQTINLGFRPAKVIALSVDPSACGYSAAQTNEVYDQILSRLRSMPGIAAASITTISPLEGSLITLDTEVPGRAPKSSTSPRPVVYCPIKQSQSSGFTLLVRGNTNSAATISAIEHAIHSVNPKLPIQDLRTLQAQIEQGISSERILSFLSTLFSALAILLCGIGLYAAIIPVNALRHQ